MYVFDAKTQGFESIRGWLGAVAPGSPAPFVTVIAPKRHEELTAQEYRDFVASAAPLDVYPLARPEADDRESMLAYVASVVDLPSSDFRIQGQGPTAPDYSMYAGHPSDAFERAAKHFLRPIPRSERVD